MSGIVVELYDTDGTTLLDVLEQAFNVSWRHELSKLGSGTFTLPADDPKLVAVTPRRIVKFRWLGAVRFAIRLDQDSWIIGSDLRTVTVSGPGLLALLGDAVIYPEFGLTRRSTDQRRFFWGSKAGSWYSSANWSAPVGYRQDNTSYVKHTAKGGPYPTGWVDGAAQWISATDPAVAVAPCIDLFRATLTLSAATKVGIYCTGDDSFEFYVDGEQQLSAADEAGWQQTYNVILDLDSGTHQLAALVENRVRVSTSTNVTAFICAVTTLTPDNKPDQILLRSDTTHWTVHRLADGTTATPGWARAQILYQLVTEAQARSAAGPSRLSLGFTGSTDTNGTAWTDNTDLTFTVAQVGLDEVASQLAESVIDVDVDPVTLALNAWTRRGADLSASVRLFLARDPAGYQTDRDATLGTRLLGHLADGSWLEVPDTSAETTYGRVERGVSLGSTASQVTATEVIDAQLAETSTPRITAQVQASSLVGATPYVDYGLGDTIGVPGHRGAGVISARVLAFTVQQQGEQVQAWPEFAHDPTGAAG